MAIVERGLIASALARQEEERVTAFAISNEALSRLMEASPEELIGIVHVLRNKTKVERELAARLLGSESLSGAVVRAEVDAFSSSESDPEILGWLVSALKNTRDPASLPAIVRFATHGEAQVRFQVPDAVVACANEFSQTAAALFLLAEDLDRDVRWSAVFELVAWLESEDGRLTDDGRKEIEGRLRTVLNDESDSEISELAESAFAR